jgi:hypothetical protein
MVFFFYFIQPDNSGSHTLQILTDNLKSQTSLTIRMNKMVRKYVRPDLNIIFPTLVIVWIIVAATLALDSNLLLNKAFAQNATTQSIADQPLQNLIDKVKPALEHIDQAIDALRNNDSSRALDEVNLADTELFKITQNLSASEE